MIKFRKMQTPEEPFSIIDWDNTPIEKHAGETGSAWTRSFESENARIVLAEYSPGFRADHWCCRGHIMHVLDGELNVELRDGKKIGLVKGMSCFFSDDRSTAHKPFTVPGAFLLIVDLY